ncbi:MAG: hypothetical protein Q7K13_04730 [Polynucleobacter sp.]|uniref:hypothetical protein n=1 Tax=Polynucleobacter sp. TaxID=2029855 RepID=UPI0027246A91|nr:hypothetical protein [Polynucleobacter sp.]MDO8713768.1 hypothetical protein [Polynucleobacter sp.]
MNRRELDKEILNAIEVLKQHGKKVTAINIQNISEAKLRLYQIYTSKHKNQMEVRDKKSKIVEVKTEAEAASGKTENINIDLCYQIYGISLTIAMKEATADDIDDAIEELNFIFKKSIQRLEREKAELH